MGRVLWGHRPPVHHRPHPCLDGPRSRRLGYRGRVPQEHEKHLLQVISLGEGGLIFPLGREIELVENPEAESILPLFLASEQRVPIPPVVPGQLVSQGDGAARDEAGPHLIHGQEFLAIENLVEHGTRHVIGKSRKGVLINGWMGPHTSQRIQLVPPKTTHEKTVPRDRIKFTRDGGEINRFPPPTKYHICLPYE